MQKDILIFRNDKVQKWTYRTSILCIFLVAVFLRVAYVDVNREINIGSDESVYHYAAENLLKYGVLTNDRMGEMFYGNQQVQPTTTLSPGYPLYIALFYKLFNHSTQAVFVSHVILSLITFWLIYKTLILLHVGKPYIVISMIFALLYPGFYYNVDRMLTETLFTALFMGAIYLFLLGKMKDNLFLIGVSAVLLGYATHVRALAFPFILVLIIILLVTERKNVKRMIAKIGVLVGVVLLCMLPWWIRNLMTFNTFMFFSDAGVSPKIWGAVPYYLDVFTSAEGKNLSQIVDENMGANPAVFYKWRIFGFFQYMWGDIWDENLVHTTFRPLIILQQLIIVPCLIAVPYLIRKCREEVVLISSIPIIYTLLNMPFHGLPRYVYPAVPFVFVLLGLIIEKIVKRDNYKDNSALIKPPLFRWQYQANQWVKRIIFVFAILFSINLYYSVYIFAYNIDAEMSKYRLSKYMGISTENVKYYDLVSSQTYDAQQMEIVNATLLHGQTYKNNVDEPAIIRVKDQPVDNSVVTEVIFNIKGGYLFDYMTVYWKGDRSPGMHEEFVYRFPRNKFQRSHKIYIDDDVEELIFVPTVFRWGTFKLDSVQINKYRIT